jgi:hypothetical protein
METGLVVSVSALVPGQLQMICCGVAYHLSEVLLERAVVARHLHRRLRGR